MSRGSARKARAAVRGVKVDASREGHWRGGPLVRSGESGTSALAPQAPAFCVGARRAAAGAHGRDAATPPAGAPQHRRLGSGVQTRDSVAAKSSLRRPETDVS